MPAFDLPATDGGRYHAGSFDEYRYLVLFFTCNHCPYVRNSDALRAELVNRYRVRGVGFVGVNANSVETHASDGMTGMRERMAEHRFPWVYLRDETQQVARAYGALRTPHYYLFGPERTLLYTGRGLDNPREPHKATGNDLERALDEALAGAGISNPLTNPVGCNVKWTGRDAHWMPPDACDLV